MPDRDSVIKGLELLAHWPDGLIITDKEKWIKPLCETAVAMLKEQEALKPFIGHCNWWFQCGKCKAMIDYGDKFCRQCGQEVKWE